MKILIILFLSFSLFADEETEEPKSGLFENQKEKMIEEVNPNKDELECIKNSDNRNALNRCKKTIQERKRLERKTE